MNSGLKVKVIFKSSYLDLSKSDSLCKIYHARTNVSFYTLNFEEFFKNSPVEGIKSRIAKSKVSFTDYSNVLRYLLLYKYGGFYMDIDVLVMKSLSRLENFIPITMLKTEML